MHNISTNLEVRNSYVILNKNMVIKIVKFTVLIKFKLLLLLIVNINSIQKKKTLAPSKLKISNDKPNSLSTLYQKSY